MPFNSNEIRGWLEDLRIEWQVPGLAAAVLKDGEIVYLEGHGLRDVEGKLAVTPQTRFAVGSTTKAFTTMAMAMLVDEGVLDWDEPVRSYIPSFKLWDKFATERVTPRDLVSHRTGLARHDNLWVFSSFSRAELVERLQYLEPAYDLRTTYQYSNLMFMTAGYLVERLTGASWEEFVKSRILEPLGMDNTFPGPVDSAGFQDFAFPYSKKDGEVSQIPYFSKIAVGPAGSISSSASDMARWLMLHLNGGIYQGKRLVSEKHLVEMHSPQMIIQMTGNLTASEKISLFDEIGFGTYGLGWRINTYRDRTMVHHAGGIDGFSAFVSMIPEEGCGIILLSNLNGTPLPFIASFGLYDRLLGLEPISWSGRVKALVANETQDAQEDQNTWEANRHLDTVPSHKLDDYTGRYSHPAYGELEISVKEGGLVLDYGGYVLPLTHYHYDIFYLAMELEGERVPVSFSIDLQGNIYQVSIPLEPAVADITFSRTKTH